MAQRTAGWVNLRLMYVLSEGFVKYGTVFLTFKTVFLSVVSRATSKMAVLLSSQRVIN